ncbi:hypothetical protein L917_12542 [Phytophthora nicotianae]|uniref:Uncharacterized protein n=1 Tax=Phytophthora nicotianae TaxID=4792 RepID=W2GHG7_PHYNI|nr:hypothetical protein L915_12789 [Phytophthora nicotianae]ETL88379.1 hypothetical protein L917_12542 [Phytophthora nicotianae]ETM41628.1 hypothetical protein L914_12620 [Phytophthora nicotianae]
MVASALDLRKPIEELLRRILDRHEGYKDFSIGPDDRLAVPFPGDVWRALDELSKF